MKSSERPGRNLILKRTSGIVPASRMKADIEHRVPITPRAAQIINSRMALWQAKTPFVFAGAGLKEAPLKYGVAHAHSTGWQGRRHHARFSVKLPGLGRRGNELLNRACRKSTLPTPFKIRPRLHMLGVIFFGNALSSCRPGKAIACHPKVSSKLLTPILMSADPPRNFGRFLQ